MYIHIPRGSSDEERGEISQCAWKGKKGRRRRRRREREGESICVLRYIYIKIEGVSIYLGYGSLGGVVNIETDVCKCILTPVETVEASMQVRTNIILVTERKFLQRFCVAILHFAHFNRYEGGTTSEWSFIMAAYTVIIYIFLFTHTLKCKKRWVRMKREREREKKRGKKKQNMN
jgi:hypothetical protein